MLGCGSQTIADCKTEKKVGFSAGWQTGVQDGGLVPAVAVWNGVEVDQGSPRPTNGRASRPAGGLHLR